MEHVATGLEAVEKTLHKTNEWLIEVETGLGVEDRHIAYQCLRSVLHVLRDRLPVEEAAQLGSQLPLLIRGVYYEDFNPSGMPVKDRKPDEFLGRILDRIPPFDVTDPERIARSVFQVLKRRVSGGEIDDVIANFPKSLRFLWD